MFGGWAQCGGGLCAGGDGAQCGLSVAAASGCGGFSGGVGGGGADGLGAIGGACLAPGAEWRGGDAQPLCEWRADQCGAAPAL